MEVEVVGAKNVPAQALLSMRIGSVRRQAAVQLNDPCAFSASGSPDVLRLEMLIKDPKSHVVSLAGLQPSHDVVETVEFENGASIDLRVFCARRGPPQRESMASKHKAAIFAKEYLDEHDVQHTLQSMVQHLLRDKPASPFEFMAEFLKKRARQDGGVSTPQDVPSAGPKPSQPAHFDARSGDGIAQVWLRGNPSVDKALESTRSSSGASLDLCLQALARGKSDAGIVACDADCYKVFHDVFDPVLAALHPDFTSESHPIKPLAWHRVSEEIIDASGTVTGAAVVSLRRNLQGFPLEPLLTSAQREAIEQLLLPVLKTGTGRLKGTYLPLPGSTSCATMPKGMSPAQVADIIASGLPFPSVQHSSHLAAAADWPQARGIFVSQDRKSAVLVNECDHLCVVGLGDGGDVGGAFSRACKVLEAVHAALPSEEPFLVDTRLGYLTVHPKNLGTGMSIDLLAELTEADESFEKAAKEACVEVFPAAGYRRWLLHSAAGLGRTEVNQATEFIEACAQLLSQYGGELPAPSPARGRRPQPANPTITVVGGASPPSPAPPNGTTADQQAALRVQPLPTLAAEEAQRLAREKALAFLGRQAGPDAAAPAAAAGPAVDPATLSAAEREKLARDKILAFVGTQAEAGTAGPVEGTGKTGGGLSKQAQRRQQAKAKEEAAREAEQSGDHHQQRPGEDDTHAMVPLPDLSGYHTAAAVFLQSNTEAYEAVARRMTPDGVKIGACIAPALADKGHALVRSMGLVAGDGESYTTFSEVFMPILQQWHHLPRAARHCISAEPSQITNSTLDSPLIKSVTVQIARNFAGFPFLPHMQADHRREIERTLASLFMRPESHWLKGKYYPLAGSASYLPKPNGMSEKEEEVVRAAVSDLIPLKPSSVAAQAAGFDRDWPDARGVFVGIEPGLGIQINCPDHITVIATGPASDVKDVYTRARETTRAIQAEGAERGLKYARLDHMGFLTTHPEMCGTALTAKLALELPNIGGKVEFKEICQHFSLDARNLSGSMWEITSNAKLGCSAVDQMNMLIEGCRDLVDKETHHQPAASAPITARSFSARIPSKRLPDLSKNTTVMGQVLAKHPALYEDCFELKTPTYGFTLAQCIQVGMEVEDPSRTDGLVAKDSECFQTFAGLFHEVSRAMHGRTGTQVWSRDASMVTNTIVDPSGQHQGKATVTVRRNLLGFPFAGAIGRDQRREIERLLAAMVMQRASDCFEGTYYPLRGSKSYPPKPTGITAAVEAEMTSCVGMMQPVEGKAAELLEFNADWPDARGAFWSTDKALAVWVNGEDHLCVVSTHSDVCKAFQRAQEVCAAISAQLPERHEFARSKTLGFLGPWCSLLGTRMTVELELKLPSCPADPSELAEEFDTRVTTGPGIVAVRSESRVGLADVDQVNAVIECGAELVRLAGS
mmetsp:Transcript_102139/g.234020  ORF Transcript_102139/g.234020 Transcript_102139/m.234020 type:complete len:1412 (+) Transcript_102139:38-4273(+)